MESIPRGISGIYRIECTTTGKFYIGSSKDIRARWKTHRTALNAQAHHTPHLQHAWNKYGADAFVITVVEACDSSQLAEREQHYLDTLRPYDADIGMNVGHCAECPARGRKLTAEQRKRMSETRQPISDKTRARLRAAQAQRPPITEETREKFREIGRNRKRTDEQRAKIRAAHRKASPESRKKMSEKAKARPPRTESTRAKVSAALREKWAAGNPRVYQARHIVTTPDGEELLVNFTAFCRKHGLSFNGMMHAVRTGGVYRGYRARRA